MRVGLLLKLRKPEAVEIARELVATLAARRIETLVVGGAASEELAGGRSGIEPAADVRLVECSLVVVLGGDGTLLHAADLVADQGVPILGINLGNLGFITSFSKEQARASLEQALDGQLVLERRMRLRVVLTRAAGEQVTRFACNDAVISQGAIARLLEYETFLDGQEISTYRADGLIIATPTGSTAYNLAAGGPILTPEVEGMVLSPICPHTLTHRPLVVPAASRLAVRLGEYARDVMLTVDGQWATELSHRDRVEVHAAHRPLLLYRPAGSTYFDILRAKLHWGERMGTRRDATAPEDAREGGDDDADGPAAAGTTAATSRRRRR